MSLNERQLPFVGIALGVIGILASVVALDEEWLRSVFIGVTAFSIGVLVVPGDGQRVDRMLAYQEHAAASLPGLRTAVQRNGHESVINNGILRRAQALLVKEVSNNGAVSITAAVVAPRADGTLGVAYGYGMAPSLASIKLASSGDLAALLSGASEPLKAPDLDAYVRGREPQPMLDLNQLQRQGMRSLVAAPISSAAKTVGVLAFMTPERDALGTPEDAYAVQLAAVIGIVLDHSGVTNIRVT